MHQINENSVIKRKLLGLIQNELEPGKVLVLYGPRRSGKTTLLKTLQDNLKKERILFLHGDNVDVLKPLSSQSVTTLKRLIGDATLLLIDEAQMVPAIGQNLKLIVDSLPHVKVIASGSASLDLAQSVGAPLIGRKKTMWLYPISAQELADHFGQVEFDGRVDEALLYGSYPELYHLGNQTKKQQYLFEIVDSSLYKDVLALEDIRNSRKIRDLLVLLAFQIGKEVSLNELGDSLGLDKNTIARYLDLLEKSFVILNIRGFSRNLRKEVTKISRYYFFDNGIRNALINNFNSLNLRDDVGALWENWLAMERVKKQNYTGQHTNNYFWRTYDQKEIDWLEEKEGRLMGYEFSWKEKQIKASLKKEFTETYPNSDITNIHKSNYHAFVL